MSTDALVRDLADNIMGSTGVGNMVTRTSADNLLPLPGTQEQELMVTTSSSFLVTTDRSILSSEFDHWLRSGDTNSGNVHSPNHGANFELSPVLQFSADNSTNERHSTTTTSLGPSMVQTPSLGSTGFWYLAMMILPVFSVTRSRWRCTPSSLLSSVEVMFTSVAGFCRRARSRLQRLGEEPMQELFAAGMDLVLVVYAIGFLLISLYQASVTGHFF